MRDPASHMADPISHINGSDLLRISSFGSCARVKNPLMTSTARPAYGSLGIFDHLLPNLGQLPSQSSQAFPSKINSGIHLEGYPVKTDGLLLVAHLSEV